MMYSLVELQRSLLHPAVRLADLTQKLHAGAHNPISGTLLARAVAGGSEVFSRTFRRYEKPRFEISEGKVGGQAARVTEVAVRSEPFCTLLHFRKQPLCATDAPLPVQPRLLIVAPLSGHFATLLRDTVRTALSDFDVYVTDWADAKMVPRRHGPFHLDDYVHCVIDFLRHLGPQTRVMAVCQPTVPVLAAASLMAQEQDPCAPHALVLMGGPVDARQSPTAVNEFAQRHPHSFFASRLIQRVPVNYPGFLRRVYPGYLQHLSFVAMNPDRHLRAHLEFCEKLLRGDDEGAAAHRRFYDEYNAVLDMPAEYYLDTIRVVFQEYHLARGCMTVRGVPVRPAAIRQMALLTVEGEQDDIAGRGQTQAAQTLCTGIPASRRQHLLAPGVGHYGLFSGRRFRDEIYPQIRSFLAA